MYSLIHAYPLRTLLLEHLPSLLIALVIAETFYKFHSFTLECLAFLATWYLLDGLRHWVSGRRTDQHRKQSPRSD
jgi:hypothetical protein